MRAAAAPIRYNEKAVTAIFTGLAITSIGIAALLYKERSPQAIAACITGLALSIFSKYEDSMNIGVGMVAGSVVTLINRTTYMKVFAICQV